MDTEKDVGEGTPVQTLFHLPPFFVTAGSPSLLLERGAHKPILTEPLAPFYQDPTQRIAVLDVWNSYISLAFPIEALLKLARDRGECEIKWDGWKEHVVFSPAHESGNVNAWVSGCRLFRFNTMPNTHIEVYDFSARGRAGLESERTSQGLGTVRRLQPIKVKMRSLRNPTRSIHGCGGRKSIVFIKSGQVSVLQFPLTTRLNDALPSLRERTIRGVSCTYGCFNGSTGCLLTAALGPP